jgi:hypothetical protein
MAVTIDAKSIRAQLRQFGDGMLLMARSKLMRLHPIAAGLEIRINSASARGTLAGGDG